MRKFLRNTVFVTFGCTLFVVSDSVCAVLPGVQFGGGLSATSGLNGFVGYANKKHNSFWWKRLGLRLDFASTRPIRSAIQSGIDKFLEDEDIEIGDELSITDVTLKSQHVGAMIDFYPFGNTWFLGGWRLSGGYYFGKFDVSAKLTSQELPDGEFEFELGDERFKYTGGTMNATSHADWKFSGPYVGTGFDLGLFYGFKIYFDAGVVFTSRVAELRLDTPTTNLSQWNGSGWVPVDVNELEDAKKQTLQDAQDELDKIKFFPVVKVGFMYRF